MKKLAFRAWLNRGLDDLRETESDTDGWLSLNLPWADGEMITKHLQSLCDGRETREAFDKRGILGIAGGLTTTLPLLVF